MSETPEINFALAAEPAAWLTSGQLAARWGCTDQTVTNYRLQDMPTLGQSGDGAWMFDPAACERWRADNKPGAVKGGKRAGAGRKKGKKKAKKEGESREANGESGGEGAEKSKSEDAEKKTTDEVEKKSEAAGSEVGSVEAALARVHGPEDVDVLRREGKLTPAVAKALKDAEDAKAQMVEQARERGELIKTDEARERVARWAGVIVSELDGLPGRVAAEVGAGPEVLEKWRNEVDRVKLRIADAVLDEKGSG